MILYVLIHSKKCPRDNGDPLYAWWENSDANQDRSHKCNRYCRAVKFLSGLREPKKNRY